MAQNENGCSRLHGTMGPRDGTCSPKARLEWGHGRERERHSGYIGENRREEGEERSEYDVKTPLPVFALDSFFLHPPYFPKHEQAWEKSQKEETAEKSLCSRIDENLVGSLLLEGTSDKSVAVSAVNQ